MTRQTIDAIYEGGVLKPLESPALPEGEKVRITLDISDDQKAEATATV